MLMKKAAVFFFGIILLVLMGLPVESIAAVNINVGISIPPPPVFRFHTPPPMVVIPGTYVYAVPDIDVEIFFYQGYWYRPHEEHWFRSKAYNGPWAYLDSHRIPGVIYDLPPDYHYWLPPGHQKIPYGHFKNNWGRWERERYWEYDARWRESRHEVHGRDFGHAGPPPPRGSHKPPGPPDHGGHGQGKSSHK